MIVNLHWRKCSIDLVPLARRFERLEKYKNDEL